MQRVPVSGPVVSLLNPTQERNGGFNVQAFTPWDLTWGTMVESLFLFAVLPVPNHQVLVQYTSLG